MSESCIATYPGDFAQALIALDATSSVEGPGGAGADPFAEPARAAWRHDPSLRRPWSSSELITAFGHAGDTVRRAARCTLKSATASFFEFALASAAVALDIAGGAVREARIALGGVATVPWRASKPRPCRPAGSTTTCSPPRPTRPSRARRARAQRLQDRAWQAHARARATSGRRLEI